MARVTICEKVFDIQWKKIGAGSEVITNVETEKESMPIIGVVMAEEARWSMKLLVVLTGKRTDFKRAEVTAQHWNV